MPAMLWETNKSELINTGEGILIFLSLLLMSIFLVVSERTILYEKYIIKFKYKSKTV